MQNFLSVVSFEWDDGNKQKNKKKHDVDFKECEEVFFNQPIITNQDIKHSDSEIRYFLLGQTNASRHLFIVFTIRHESIRVISARDMNRRERQIYAKA